MLTNNSTTAAVRVLLLTLGGVERARVGREMLHFAAAKARNLLAFLHVARLMTNGGPEGEGVGAGPISFPEKEN